MSHRGGFDCTVLAIMEQLSIARACAPSRSASSHFNVRTTRKNPLSTLCLAALCLLGNGVLLQARRQLKHADPTLPYPTRRLLRKRRIYLGGWLKYYVYTCKSLLDDVAADHDV